MRKTIVFLLLIGACSNSTATGPVPAYPPLQANHDGENVLSVGEAFDWNAALVSVTRNGEGVFSIVTFPREGQPEMLLRALGDVSVSIPVNVPGDALVVESLSMRGDGTWTVDVEYLPDSG